MKIEDCGFIVFIKKFEENSLLVKVLSKENGLISGYVKHTKKDINQYQIGNLVNFSWSAKSTNQLGTIKIEVVKSFLSNFISEKFYLNLIESITVLINELIYERYLEQNLYNKMYTIFNYIIQNKEKELILKEYLYFENILLNILGTGIIFDNAVNLNELYYISPKTGLAVSKIKGEPYKDKLLYFPLLFQKEKIEQKDIFQCFEVMSFFLKKYLDENNNSQKYKKFIIIREKLFI
ncbi:MAG TPA: DNA repair protein RecO [Rickettsiales bacterium]|nr:DNA repair protein RecO [Rickettsiales bacterium]